MKRGVADSQVKCVMSHLDYSVKQVCTEDTEKMTVIQSVGDTFSIVRRQQRYCVGYIRTLTVHAVAETY